MESRVGRSYERNYDRYFADEHAPLFAVADSECDDGTAGDIVCSELGRACDSLPEASRIGPDAVRDVLTRALHAANAAIRRIPKGVPGYGGGAAVTAFSCVRDVGIAVHVGDCRLYVLERDEWVRVTSDHTLREAKLSGEYPLDESEAASDASVILRAVGVTEPMRVDECRFPIDPERTVMLCTRGAWQPMDMNGDGEPIRAATNDLLPLMMRRYSEDGERDNATVVVVRVSADV
jgi:serine/threonine protein phosphatase PrpC